MSFTLPVVGDTTNTWGTVLNGWLTTNVPNVYNVEGFGAVGDLIQSYTGSTTASSSTYTDAAMTPFTGTKQITVDGAATATAYVLGCTNVGTAVTATIGTAVANTYTPASCTIQDTTAGWGGTAPVSQLNGSASALASGNVVLSVRATTGAGQAISVGDQLTLSNGTNTVTLVSLTAVSASTTNAVITVSSAQLFTQGQPVTVSGITGFSTNNPNGTFMVTGVPAPATNSTNPATTITFTATSAPTGTYGSGGTATTPAPLQTTVTCTVSGTGMLGRAATNSVGPTVGTAITAVSMQWSTATITVASTAGAAVGMPVTVSGITTQSPTINDTWVITQLTATTITFSAPTTWVAYPGAYGGEGTAVWARYSIWYTDNSAALNAALNAGPGVVFFPPGTYGSLSELLGVANNPYQVQLWGSGTDSTRLVNTSNNPNLLGMAIRQAFLCWNITLDGGYIGTSTGCATTLNWDSSGRPNCDELVFRDVHFQNITQTNQGSNSQYLAQILGSLTNRAALHKVILDNVTVGPFGNPWQDNFSVDARSVQGNNITFYNLCRTPNFFVPDDVQLSNVTIRDPIGNGANSGQPQCIMLGESHCDHVQVDNLIYTDAYQQGQTVYIEASHVSLSNSWLVGQRIPITSASLANPCVITLSQAPAQPLATGQIVELAGLTVISGTAWSNVQGKWPITQISTTSFSVPINTSAYAAPYLGVAVAQFDSGSSSLDLNQQNKFSQSRIKVTNSYLGAGITVENGSGAPIDLQLTGCEIGTVAQAVSSTVGACIEYNTGTYFGTLLATGCEWNTNIGYFMVGPGASVANQFIQGGTVVQAQNGTFDKPAGINSTVASSTPSLMKGVVGLTDMATVLPTSLGSWVSGTAKQVSTHFDVFLTIPVTFTPSAGAAATLVAATSPTSGGSYTTVGGTETVPAGTALDSFIRNYTYIVRSGEYIKFTAANATFGTATWVPV